MIYLEYLKSRDTYWLEIVNLELFENLVISLDIKFELVRKEFINT